MRRKLYQKLLDWKQNSAGQTAVMIDGARRVGKSYLAEQFARCEYKSYILIDFNRAGEEIKDLFLHYLNDLDTFFLYLSAIYNVTLHERESLIILDEIQLFPRARAAVKYLVQDGRYDYMETGSLISIRENVQDIVIPSEERHLRLNPMDLEEFMWAMGNDTLMPVIQKCFSEKKALGQALHRKAMDLFRQYLIVGGMPQSVKEYAQTKHFENVDLIKRDILMLYRADIAKHARGYERKVESIFDELPEQLQKHEKKFTLSSLGKGVRYREYESSFLWLEDSGIVNICYNTTQPSIGLKMNRDNTTMKLYMADTGLLISHAFDENGIVSNELYKKLLLGKLEVNEGMLFENIVAQILTASGHKLYFYSNPSRTDKEKRMEIDFLIAKSKITNRHNISPIEVKSGKRYTLTSLKKFETQFSQQLHTSYVLHTGDYINKEGIEFLPVYMAPFL